MQDLQLDFFEIPSPCRGVCKSDDKGYCQGCYRTRDERFGWKELSNQEKQKVIKLCLQREKRRTIVAKEKVEEVEVEVEVEVFQPSLLDQPANSNICTEISEDDFDDFEL